MLLMKGNCVLSGDRQLGIRSEERGTPPGCLAVRKGRAFEGRKRGFPLGHTLLGWPQCGREISPSRGPRRVIEECGRQEEARSGEALLGYGLTIRRPRIPWESSLTLAAALALVPNLVRQLGLRGRGSGRGAGGG